MTTPYKVTPSELVRLQNKFSQFDADGNGTVNLQELETVLRAMGLAPTKMELTEFMNKMTADQTSDDKGVTFNEVVKFVESIQKEVGPDEQFRLAFSCFDRDGTGVISLDVLKHALSELTSDPLNPDDFEDLVRECDLSGVGEIRYEDLKRVLTTSLC